MRVMVSTNAKQAVPEAGHGGLDTGFKLPFSAGTILIQTFMMIKD